MSVGAMETGKPLEDWVRVKDRTQGRVCALRWVTLRSGPTYLRANALKVYRLCAIRQHFPQMGDAKGHTH